MSFQRGSNVPRRVSLRTRLARVAGAASLVLASGAFALAVPLAGPVAAATPAGEVVGWGYNGAHQIDIPDEAKSGATQVAGGCNHSLALKSSGKVVAWGDDTFHQTEVPPGAQSGVIAISAGCEHSLALKSNGTIVAWGDDTYHQTEVPPAPAGFKWFAVGAGEHGSVALAANTATSSAVMYGWGDGGTVWWTMAVAYGVKDVEDGQTALIYLQKDATVAVSGSGPASVLAVPPGLSEVVAVDIGREHALVLESNGTVVAWGENGYGQITVPSGLSGVKTIAAGGYHNLALKADGTVVAWGRSDRGQITVPPLAPGMHYSAIGGGILHSLAIVVPNTAGPPTAVTATASDGAADVLWTAPASDGGNPISGYTVTSAPDGKTCSTTGALTCTVGGLTNGTAYTFTVVAVNAGGSSLPSAKSNSVTPAGPTAPPPTATPTAAATPTPTSTPAATPTPPVSTSAGATGTTAPGTGAASGGGSESLLFLALGLALGLIVALACLAVYLGFIRPRAGQQPPPQEPPPGPVTRQPPPVDPWQQPPPPLPGPVDEAPGGPLGASQDGDSKTGWGPS